MQEPYSLVVPVALLVRPAERGQSALPAAVGTGAAGGSVAVGLTAAGVCSCFQPRRGSSSTLELCRSSGTATLSPAGQAGGCGRGMAGLSPPHGWAPARQPLLVLKWQTPPVGANPTPPDFPWASPLGLGCTANRAQGDSFPPLC